EAGVDGGLGAAGVPPAVCGVVAAADGEGVFESGHEGVAPDGAGGAGGDDRGGFGGLGTDDREAAETRRAPRQEAGGGAGVRGAGFEGPGEAPAHAVGGGAEAEGARGGVGCGVGENVL